METIGERVKKIRKSIDYVKNQSDFAEGIGITQASLAQIENGTTKKISKPVLMLMDLKYKVNIGYLLSGNGEMFKTDSSSVSTLSSNAGRDLNKDIIENKINGSNSALVNGNGNSVVAGENNRLEISNCQDALDVAILEIKHLKEVINAKDQIIEEMRYSRKRLTAPIIEVFSIKGVEQVNLLHIDNIIPCTGKEPEFEGFINSASGREFPCCTILSEGKRIFAMQDASYIWRLIKDKLSVVVR